MVTNGCFKKAELIAEGTITIPKDLRLPYFLSCSITGPDAGSYSIVISFDRHRLKIPVSRKLNGIFSLIQDDDRYKIIKNGKLYIDNVKILPCYFHAPEQAFISLNEECVFNCAFCAAPKLKRTRKQMKIENVMNSVIEAGNSGRINAVALTSGVGKKPSDTVKEMVSAIRRLKKELSLPIGVEPFVEKKEQIEALYEAGADEIKLNIHSWNREIFNKVCPQWNYDRTINMIETACKIFGNGKVTSNIIFGMGEKDEDIVEGIENLAAVGCIANLRKLRINDYNRQSLLKALGTLPYTGAQRIISLAKAQKEILGRHNLNPLDLKTMCHPCGCCDLVPFKDI